MDPDFAQRRRVFVAAAITVIAVPAAFLFGRGDSSGADAGSSGGAAKATIVGTIPPPGAEPADPGAVPGDVTESPDARTAAAGTPGDVLGTTPVGYLDGTVAPDADDTPMIAVPSRRDTLTGSATFSAQITDTSVCYIPKVRSGTVATVTNLDNSFSVRCEVVAVATALTADVTLHPDAFAEIADITDAPVPVEITW